MWTPTRLDGDSGRGSTIGRLGRTRAIRQRAASRSTANSVAVVARDVPASRRRSRELSVFRTQLIELVREGMGVHGADGERIGNVELVKMGDPEAMTTRGNDMTPQ